MSKIAFRLFVSVLFILIFTVSLSAGVIAQDDEPTLREYADEIGLSVGAAIFTPHMNEMPIHGEILAREFNMLTPENEAKACFIHPQRDQYDFAAMDRLVEFAEAHDMEVHGHTLVWHQCLPDWIANGNFSRQEAIDILREHIYTVVGRYKGRVKIWDVVNEAVESGTSMRNTVWREMIGDDYIELAFQFAHEADPDALLFYNDYGADGTTRKAAKIREMVADFLERGIPIHGVGLQGHFTLGVVNQAQLETNLTRFGELGIQVQFTEVDIRHEDPPTDDIQQAIAADYRKVLQACLNVDACTGFIVWGVSDRYTWLRYSGQVDNPEVAPLLFDDDYQPKLAYYAVLDLLAQAAGSPSILGDDEMVEPDEESWATVEIPEPSKSDPAQLSPDSVPGLIYYAPFSVPITLDGSTEDWADIPRVRVDSGTTVPEGNDTVLNFAAAADSEYLYLLAEVEDSSVVYGNYPTSEWYREDSVEFYINATGNLELFEYEPGIVQIGILAANIAGPDQPLFGGGNSGDSQVTFAAVETDTGYVIEVAVPLETAVWNIVPEQGSSIGFQAHLNGSSGEDRDTKLIWSRFDKQDQSWNNPSLFGQLIFWDVNE